MLFLTNPVSSNDINLIIEDYCQTILGLPDISKLEELDSTWSKILNKMSKGKMTEYMLEHFSKNKSASAVMAFAHYQAEKLSREFCGLSPKAGRRSGDEVDAVRHFIWVSLMAQYLGVEQAKQIGYLQEYRDQSTSLDSASKMDLYNNSVALDFMKSYKKRPVNILSWSSIKSKFVVSNETLKKEAMKRLNKGKFKVFQSQKSKCQRTIYPNTNDF
ncbi:MAG: hypothetical protein KC493_01790 [Bacteriovoracaceae bacterium]|nr:hypothetical protein [Bacteriovoracaceae bacterium]